MKLAIMAAGLMILGVTTASAQGRWNKSDHPYAERHHSVCQMKARELHGYERRAAADGRFSWRERRTVNALRRDLDRTCGRFRWRG